MQTGIYCLWLRLLLIVAHTQGGTFLKHVNNIGPSFIFLYCCCCCCCYIWGGVLKLHANLEISKRRWEGVCMQVNTKAAPICVLSRARGTQREVLCRGMGYLLCGHSVSTGIYSREGPVWKNSQLCKEKYCFFILKVIYMAGV